MTEEMIGPWWTPSAARRRAKTWFRDGAIHAGHGWLIHQFLSR